jgi:hypothetical protein
MLVLDPGFGVILFFKERFGSLHDHVRVVIALQRVLLQHLLIGINLLRPGLSGRRVLRSAGATTENEHGEPEGYGSQGTSHIDVKGIKVFVQTQA